MRWRTVVSFRAGWVAAQAVPNSAARRRCLVLRVDDAAAATPSSVSSRSSRSLFLFHSFAGGGVYPVTVTPFHHKNGTKEESLDLLSLDRMIGKLNATGARGVTVLGVLGESHKLSDGERESVVRTAVEAAAACTIQSNSGPPPSDDGGDGKLPDNDDNDDESFVVCVGVSHPGMAVTIDRCRFAADCGANAVMVSPPTESAHDDKDGTVLLESCQRIADACPDLTIVLQDHPASTGVQLSIETLARTVREVESIRCVKLESLPTMDRLISLGTAFQADNIAPSRCAILTGLGALYAGFDVSVGRNHHSGFMTGFAFPEVLRVMCERMHDNNDDAADTAWAVYEHFLPLIVLEQTPGTTGLAIRKTLYQKRGWIDHSHVRRPGTTELSSAMRNALDQQLRRIFGTPEQSGNNSAIDWTQPLSSKAILNLALRRRERERG